MCGEHFPAVTPEDPPRNRDKTGWIARVGLYLATAACFPYGLRADGANPLPQERIELLELKPVREPSGVCYHALRQSLFAVDDGGTICEFRTDGKILHQRFIRAADFEGITLDPSSGLLYLAVEGAETLLEVDPKTLRPRREFLLPRTFEGKTVMKEGGQGIEAVTFVPDKKHPHGGTFFIANQSFDLNATEDISALLEVEVPLKGRGKPKPGEVRILRCFKAGVIDLSDLHYDAKSDIIYALSDATDQLLAYTRTGKLLKSWTLPGENQEGITVDSEGMLYLAQDSGGVLKLKIDWKRMSLRR